MKAGEVSRALLAKFEARDLDGPPIGLTVLTDRRAEFEGDWERNLLDLLPAEAAADFVEVWDAVVEYVSVVLGELEA